MTMAMKATIFVWIFCSIGMDLTVAGDKCAAQFQYKDEVQLCYNQSQTVNTPSPPSPYSCDKPGFGFVLEELVIAPITSYTNCGLFHNTNLYNYTCLRKEAENTNDFDSTAFNILGLISGKNSFNKSLPIEMLRFKTAESNLKMESAFLAMKKSCKAVNNSTLQNTTVNKMISLCSSHTVQDVIVTLTLGHLKEQLPNKPFMCRCTVRTSRPKYVNVFALDIRLQGEGGSCGETHFDVKTGNTSDSAVEHIEHIECKGKEALYGSKALNTTGRLTDEMTLTLTSNSTKFYPTAVWIEIREEYKPDEKFMEVSCEDLLLLSVDLPKGLTLPIIIGVSVGSFVLLVFLVLLIIWILKRRSRGSMALACVSCHGRGRDGKGKKPYRPVSTTEPVYSEPGNPRPANRDPYTFPADAKVQMETTYAEPDPNGQMFATKVNPLIPPPLPDSPPPVSPPAGYVSSKFPFVAEPPPKPERTLLKKDKWGRKRPECENPVQPGEEYDRILSTGTGRKPVGDRDKQNNIIDGDQGDAGESSMYSHLDKGDNYSHVAFQAKSKVIDNDYDAAT